VAGSPALTLHQPVIAWYAEHGRSLPWREPDRTPWGVLVSEVMLQQTPVARVLPVWREWLARWPAPTGLAAAGAGEAIRAWGRLGYPRRALRLHEAAGVIATRHGGRVPDRHDALLALPGIGRYTAAAVAAFAFGQRRAVLDTNVRRVLARALGGVGSPPASLTVAEVLRAEAAVPARPSQAAIWAAASMELGALVCTTRTPACSRCPIASRCAWRRAGYPSEPGGRSRTQGWAGTDRQVRGRILALLRAHPDAVPGRAIIEAVGDDTLSDPHQRDRCLDSLVADGLVDPLPGGRFALPG
jgi:A/G-specific adenine glycosylase